MEGPEPNGIVAVLATREQVDSALEWLVAEGVERRAISILGPGTHEDVPPELDRSAQHRSEIARYWGKWGAALGAVAGAGPIAVVVAAIAVGPVAGVLAAAIGAVAATAGVGALASGLVGLGMHEGHAREYERAIAAGKFVVVVHSDDPAVLRTARRELERLNPESIDVHGIATR